MCEIYNKEHLNKKTLHLNKYYLIDNDNTKYWKGQNQKNYNLCTVSVNEGNANGNC